MSHVYVKSNNTHSSFKGDVDNGIYLYVNGEPILASTPTDMLMDHEMASDISKALGSNIEDDANNYYCARVVSNKNVINDYDQYIETRDGSGPETDALRRWDDNGRNMYPSMGAVNKNLENITKSLIFILRGTQATKPLMEHYMNQGYTPSEIVNDIIPNLTSDEILSIIGDFDPNAVY